MNNLATNKKTIEHILKALKKLSLLNPDLRFSQLIELVELATDKKVTTSEQRFYRTDSEYLKMVEHAVSCYKRIKPKSDGLDKA